jgi:tRNA A-37 threonylcarbamoyl transferase component Bud32
MPGTFRGDSKPETIDRFQVVRLLGRGGMGDVYDAFDAGVSRYVAIKLLRADLYDVPAVAETFVSEAQRIAKLEAHENIPTVYEVGVHEHRPFIAMQKIEGLTLAELLRKRGVVSVDTLRVVASGVGGALAFAHDRGIVHCDVKPQNVLLDRAQKPYLTDFGISRARPDPLGAEAPDLCGHTPYYASPEQLAGRVPDVRSDVYSLAVMLYEMCTGKTPFGHIPQVDLPEAVRGEEPSRADDTQPARADRARRAAGVGAERRPQQAAADGNGARAWRAGGNGPRAAPLAMGRAPRSRHGEGRQRNGGAIWTDVHPQQVARTADSARCSAPTDRRLDGRLVCFPKASKQIRSSPERCRCHAAGVARDGDEGRSSDQDCEARGRQLLGGTEQGASAR